MPMPILIFKSNCYHEDPSFQIALDLIENLMAKFFDSIRNQKIADCYLLSQC